MIPGPIGFGGAPLGNLFTRIPEPDAAAALGAAWDAGIRLFDTAPHYGAGLSELRFGQALRDRPRAEFTLSTKVGRLLVPAVAAEGDQGFVGELPFRRRWDYSAEGATRSLEDSMARLGISRVDIALVHDCSEDHHGPAWRSRMEEATSGAAPLLSRLRDRGEISAWGYGLNIVEAHLAALERSTPDVLLVAGRYTLLDQGALAALFPACAARGVRVIIGGPYNSGLLAGGDTFEYQPAADAVRARVGRLREHCARHGVDLRAAALQFSAAHPVVAAVIPGGRTAAEVSENARLMQAPIPPGLWRDLRRDGLIPDEAPTPA